MQEGSDTVRSEKKSNQEIEHFWLNLVKLIMCRYLATGNRNTPDQGTFCIDIII
jgi:hypothetical protein